MPKLVDLITEDAVRVVEAVDLSPLEGTSVLITGASGLLGIYLLAALRVRAARGGRPIDLVAVTRSAPPSEMAALFEGPHVHLCRVDLGDPVATATLPITDHVIHAAGYGQPNKFMENPTKTIQLNTTATQILLERQPAHGKFLFLSSSEVYSGSPRLPHQEGDIGTTDPSHPRACYIEGKRCGEAIGHAFRNQGRAVKSARLALAYGPGTRQDDQRVLNSLIRRALLERQITLLDQGAARRSYGYITDAVEMLLSILLYGREAVYNVGGRSNITILELASAIGRLIGVPVRTSTEVKELAGAPSEVSLDLNRACAEFNKRDFVSFEDGIRRTIDWQRELYGVHA